MLCVTLFSWSFAYSTKSSHCSTDCMLNLWMRKWKIHITRIKLKYGEKLTVKKNDKNRSLGTRLYLKKVKSYKNLGIFRNKFICLSFHGLSLFSIADLITFYLNNYVFFLISVEQWPYVSLNSNG